MLRSICDGSDTIEITKGNCPDIGSFPNAFTPNNDGENDLFRPAGYGFFESYQLVIYNRYGQLGFVTDDPTIGWNGTVKGLLQDTGNYIWWCKFKLYNKHPDIQKGSVMLIR